MNEKMKNPRNDFFRFSPIFHSRSTTTNPLKRSPTLTISNYFSFLISIPFKWNTARHKVDKRKWEKWLQNLHLHNYECEYECEYEHFYCTIVHKLRERTHLLLLLLVLLLLNWPAALLCFALPCLAIAIHTFLFWWCGVVVCFVVYILFSFYRFLGELNWVCF